MSSLTSFGLSMRACHVAGMEWNWRSAQSNLSQDILEVKKRTQTKEINQLFATTQNLVQHFSQSFNLADFVLNMQK